MQLNDSSIQFEYNEESVVISVIDNTYRLTILRTAVSLHNFARMMSGKGSDCETVVTDELYKIGKEQQVSMHEFEIPFGILSVGDNMDAIIQIGQDTCPAGWTPDNKYNSKSFFSRDNKTWAKVPIFRWN